MFIPEDIWKIIKNYTFDYIQIWKQIFTKNILSNKKLNTRREFDSDLSLFSIATTTAILSVPLTYYQRRTNLYHGQTHSNTYLRGWIKFTKDKKEIEIQQKWLERQTRLNELKIQELQDDWEYEMGDDPYPDPVVELGWGLFDTDDY